MIASFACEETAKIFSRSTSRRFPADIQAVAYRKLVILHAATMLATLAGVPGNRFEKLSGDRDGSYSIRVNDQWRICFKWIENNAHDVEIVDYH
jgi:proteic killer suppression protein